MQLGTVMQAITRNGRMVDYSLFRRRPEQTIEELYLLLPPQARFAVVLTPQEDYLVLDLDQVALSENGIESYSSHSFKTLEEALSYGQDAVFN